MKPIFGTRRQARAALLASLIALAGCGHIDDIRYVSIAPYDPGEHLVPTARQPGIPRRLLTLRFTSGVDLRDYIRRHDVFGPDIQLGPCPFDETQWIARGAIYHNRVDVSANMRVPGYGLFTNQSALTSEDVGAIRAEDDMTGKGTPPYTYDAIIAYGLLWRLSDHTIIDTPIADTPHDLCFRFEGSIYLWSPVSSNVATVPAADLARALGELKPTAAVPPSSPAQAPK